jgi:dienelactone hydrolase
MATSTEDSISKKYNVSISKPTGAPVAVTVFLPGTLLQLKDYKTMVDALIGQKQLVIGFNTLNPFTGGSHAEMAEKVAKVVAAICALEQFQSLRDKKYNIMGHSLGGKVALMVAAKFDNVAKVIALDPVDAKPQEITKPEPPARPTVDLNGASAEIYLRQSELGGQGGLLALAPKTQNATIIKDMYPNKVPDGHFTVDLKAGHMSYRDTESDQASQNARKAVQVMIRQVISSQ